ncbi:MULTISPECIES: hypothetical protein [Pseudomonadaceae]|jgi:hypothetical protein|uniref:Uncharacterized protein n=2 Tax=Pseudomonadaceae TaxID=135621 RepID=A0A2N8R968_STUST|nr:MULTISPECIES: hypothetical protein [Pseudomonadaceae]MCQ4256269.1 hypothetical protein [Stutzerimonas stutzeri]PNF57632.1 hypothetical protein CXK99_20815 [Stutzerimonas stutzeri]TRO07525.1 hypothetical protein EQ829_25230 [Pseudomonas mendocina]TRO10674.1 hypothetical protein EQ836_25240 [Pseudomonas mendocina]
MRCNIELLDSNHNAWFTGTRDLPADYMLKLAAERKPAVMAQGLEFAQNAIPFFGGQLVKVVKAGGSEDQIDKAVIEFALATVVVESCLGVSDEDLLGRHFNLVVYDDGLVRYDRLDA